jgi:hypothetical protein
MSASRGALPTSSTPNAPIAEADVGATSDQMSGICAMAINGLPAEEVVGGRFARFLGESWRDSKCRGPQGPGVRNPFVQFKRVLEEACRSPFGTHWHGDARHQHRSTVERRRGQKKMKPVLLASLILASATLVFEVAHTETASSITIHDSGIRARTVAVIGDSLSWQAKSSIESAFTEAGYMARVSVNPGHALSSSWAQDTVDADVDHGQYGVIVVETASNDAVRLASEALSITRYSQLLEELIAKAGHADVVIMNAKVNAPFYYAQSDALAINRAIDKAAEEHANVRIVDWNSEATYHPSWFGADMLHLSPGLPATVLASDPPSADVQDAADTAFAQALVKGVVSSATR